MLGPKFVAGHGIWLSNSEFQRFAKAGAAVAFCPLSNLFLGSGLFRLGRALDPAHRVRVALGCDVGGGNAFSLIRVMEEAYKVGMCNNTMLDGSVNPREQDAEEAERSKLSSYRAYYLATLGGAHALYLDDVLGNFDKGKEADFVVLDWNGGQAAMRWHQSLIVGDSGPENMDQAAQVLFGIMAVGDDRNVDETWIAGHRAYKKGCALNYEGSYRQWPQRLQARACASPAATAVVVQRVPAAAADWFLEWQGDATRAAEAFAGYSGTEVFPPHDGAGDEWVTLIHFEDDPAPEALARLARARARLERLRAGRRVRAEDTRRRLRRLVRRAGARRGRRGSPGLEDGADRRPGPLSDGDAPVADRRPRDQSLGTRPVDADRQRAAASRSSSGA